MKYLELEFELAQGLLLLSGHIGQSLAGGGDFLRGGGLLFCGGGDGFHVLGNDLSLGVDVGHRSGDIMGVAADQFDGLVHEDSLLGAVFYQCLYLLEDPLQVLFPRWS